PIAEETTECFDLEMSPAWFKSDLPQKIRGQVSRETVAVIGEKRQKVDTACSIGAGVQPHDVRRDERGRICRLGFVNCKCGPDLVVEILRYAKCSLPCPRETNNILAILCTRS